MVKLPQGWSMIALQEDHLEKALRINLMKTSGFLVTKPQKVSQELLLNGENQMHHFGVVESSVAGKLDAQGGAVVYLLMNIMPLSIYLREALFSTATCHLTHC
jgi:hypothetical protein